MKTGIDFLKNLLNALLPNRAAPVLARVMKIHECPWINKYSCDVKVLTARTLEETDQEIALEGNISHDKITHSLVPESFDEKALWKKVKKFVRAYEAEDACLIFDDTVAEKPYMSKNEIICWHFDHKESKAVKGINLLSTFYHSEKGGQAVRLPIGCRIIAKTEEYIDEKSGAKKRGSPVTKNEMMQEMIKRHIQNHVRFKYVLTDSCYPSAVLYYHS
jgi:hypothetical protein